MSRTLLIAALGWVVAGPSAAEPAGRTVVYIVRHAEKATEPRRDPGLTPAGEERAKGADNIAGMDFETGITHRCRSLWGK